MDDKNISIEYKVMLEKWAEERLENIGVFKEKASDYDKFKDKIIFDLRRIYTDKAIKLFLNPINLKKIDLADGYSKITGPCGDTMEIFVKIKDNRIIDAAFTTDGCDSSVASGGMAVEMAKSMKISDVEKITQDDILKALGGLPDETKHCALLAANTLKEVAKNI